MDTVWVAGHRGMVGAAITRQLEARGQHVLKVTRDELDLRDQSGVASWLREHRPDAIILAAAKVGGIYANSHFPADFIHDNLVIQNNVIFGAHAIGVERLVFLGSSCIYPRQAPQPIREDSLLTSPLESTNEWYAIAKIAGIKLCQALSRQYGRKYVSVMPCNLYGEGDNFDLLSSHVIPALIRKFHDAKTNGSKEVVVWGTGTPLREFLYIDDLARGVIFCLDRYFEEEHINCGSGTDIAIRDLMEVVRQTVGYEGDIVMDPSKPDGTPRKLMDSTRLRDMGWKPEIGISEGLERTYQWFLAH